MTHEPFNAQERMKEAHELVRQTAARLHDTLVSMAAALVPFPYFLGSTEIQAIEAEPGGVQRADRGCIVVCPDGGMYEFTMKLESPSGMDFALERDDTVKPVDLPPEEYITYAYNAVREMAALIGDQEARARKYSF